MSSLSIRHQVYLAVGSVLLLLALIGTLSFVATSQLAGLFGSYRSTSTQTLVANQLFEDLADARFAALSYRFQASDEEADIVRRQISKILEAQQTTEQLFGDDPLALEKLQHAVASTTEFRDAFERIIVLQRDHDEIVDELEGIGPKIREGLTRILNFAYENGDTSAAYFAGIAQQELMRGRFHQERFLLTNDPGSYDKSVAFLAATKSQLETLYERLYDPDLQEMTTALIGNIEAYLEAAGRIRAAVTNRNQLRDGVIDSLGPQIKAELGELLVAVVERQKTLGPSVDQKVSETLVLAALISVGAFLIGSVLAVFVAGRLSRSVQHMADIMAKLAGGNADTNVDGLATRHELGKMTRALSVFKDNTLRIQTLSEEKEEADRQAEEARRQMMLDLRGAFGTVVDAAGDGDFSRRVDLSFTDPEINDLAAALNRLVERVDGVLGDVGTKMQALAKGDLRQRIDADYKGAFGDLKDNVNLTADQLTKIVCDIQSMVFNVTDAAAEIAAGSEDLARRTEKAAANLEQTTAATEQMASTVKQNAESAVNASQLAAEASNTAGRGGDVVGQTVKAIAGIDEAAGKITDIIGVIDEIAFQTNLLALNASVEAARAGEAGKGFAVVAQEVRQLAQRSAQAASDIKTLINDSNGRVKEGVQLANHAGDALAEIIDSIKKVSSIVETISHASQDQSAGVNEINRTVASMDELTQQNSARIEESTAAARTLSDQTQKVAGLMTFFSVDAALPQRSSNTPQPQPDRPDLAQTADTPDDEGWQAF